MITTIFATMSTFWSWAVPIIYLIGLAGTLIEFAIKYINTENFDVSIDFADDAIFIHILSPIFGVIYDDERIAGMFAIAIMSGVIFWGIATFTLILFWPLIMFTLIFIFAIVQLKSKKEFGHFLTTMGFIRRLKNV